MSPPNAGAGEGAWERQLARQHIAALQGAGGREGVKGISEPVTKADTSRTTVLQLRLAEGLRHVTSMSLGFTAWSYSALGLLAQPTFCSSAVASTNALNRGSLLRAR